jgi:hypothetical protein
MPGEANCTTNRFPIISWTLMFDGEEVFTIPKENANWRTAVPSSRSKDWIILAALICRHNNS